MFKKLKQFLNGKKKMEQPAQPVQIAQPVQPDVVADYSVNQNAEKEEKQIRIDEAVLRFLIIGADNYVSSTAIKERWCYYIFIKPGMMNELMKVSNIDVVQTVYADHGINARKHVSHLDGKEQEVLFIPSSEVAAFDNKKITFLHHTAPVYYDYAVGKRETELINRVYHAKDVKSSFGPYIIEDKQY